MDRHYSSKRFAAPGARWIAAGVWVAVAIAAGGLSGGAAAQNPPKANGKAGATSSAPATPGIKVGRFILLPEITLSEMYDDNIFATPAGKTHDWISVISPAMRLQSNWKRHEFNVWAGADIGIYARNPSENYQDFWVGTDGRYDISDTANIFTGLIYSRNHEDRATPEDVNGKNPTIYRELDHHFGFQKTLGPVVLRLGATVKVLDFDDVESLFGTINNDDRDRAETSLGGRVSYGFAPGLALFVQGGVGFRSYNSTPDDHGYDRNSHGYNVGVGLSFAVGPAFSGEFHLGYLGQIYRDGALGTIQGIDFGGRLTWLLARGLSLSAFADRSVEETTLVGAAGYLYTVLGASLAYQATDRLRLSGRMSVANSEYHGVDRSDLSYIFGVRARYHVTRRLWLAADYQYTRRQSDVPDQGYVDNRVFLRVGADLGQNRSTRIAPPAATSFAMVRRKSIFAGPYAGMLVGLSDTMTRVTGERGPGLRYDTEFGRGGFTWGGFFGYGIVVGQIYLGVEFEGRDGGDGWNHGREPGGRVFSVDERYSLTGVFRIGYVVPRTALLYAKVGLARTAFRAVYIHDSVVTNFDRTETGITIGGGIEVPVGHGLFARLDYTYVDYGTSPIAFYKGTDEFSNSSSIVSVALAYRFNGGRGAEDPAAAVGWTGPYAGVSVGFGALFSEVDGARETGTALQADFGGNGFTGGGFVGYGHTFGPIFLGLELTAEGSGARWDHRREGNPRNFSARKLVAIGGGIRVGYLIKRRILLFGTIGAVRTAFAASYRRGMQAVDDTLWRTGLRYGAGIEIPIGRRLFVRTEYTHTRYGAYSVDYVSGTDRFRNSEDLFRVSLTLRLGKTRP